MKALVYQGPGKKALEDRPIPEVKAPTDAVVKIVKTTICGTDVHILKGEYKVRPGLVIGHEPVMSSVALGLADERSGNGPVADKISAKYPTSSVAVLRSSAPWEQWALRGAELIDFHTAR